MHVIMSKDEHATKYCSRVVCASQIHRYMQCAQQIAAHRTHARTELTTVVDVAGIGRAYGEQEGVKV